MEHRPNFFQRGFSNQKDPLPFGERGAGVFGWPGVFFGILLGKWGPSFVGPLPTFFLWV
jgi:hypothetical protein